MIKADHKKAQAIVKKTAGQAATELAVFGAILIFLLGTIVRTAVGNGYEQDQNFKAMRMAMLASWNGSKANPGEGAAQNTSHNSSQVLVIEDRLSPDYNKYGDLDRSPFIASGSGTFSYNLLYPLSQASDVIASSPVMDVYINGQHFPFSLASYVPNLAITIPTSCPYTAGSCAENQCLRNQREWTGGVVQETSFVSPSVAPITVTNPSCSTAAYPTAALQRECQEQINACTIFTDLENAGFFSSANTTTGASNSIIGSCGTTMATDTAMGVISPAVTSPLEDSSQWSTFVSGPQGYEASFPNNTTKSSSAYYNTYLQAILNILHGGNRKYKLFYTLVANPGDAVGSQFTLAYPANPQPSCPSHPCMNNELSPDVPLLDYYGKPTTDGYNNTTNVNGVMQYDLLRMGYYSPSDAASPPCASATPPCQPVSQQFPIGTCPTCMRNYVAWQWAATAGTTAAMIGLNTSNDQYPLYDIDGRLKEVTIYHIWQDSSSTTHVAFEDNQAGDIDQTWDANSCGPKPGLQQDSQIFTFTSPGCANGAACPSSGVCLEGTACGSTYLQINEGKLYNTETGKVVRSVNKRDSIDLIQRTVQLSNNTGRFCTIACTDGSTCGAATPGYCANGKICTTTSNAPSHPCGTISGDSECASPNPVEVCEDESTNTSNCFTGQNSNGQIIAQTCYDTNLNVIFVRSRLEDRRGHFWMTKTSGQLKVQ